MMAWAFHIIIHGQVKIGIIFSHFIYFREVQYDPLFH